MTRRSRADKNRHTNVEFNGTFLGRSFAGRRYRERFVRLGAYISVRFRGRVAEKMLNKDEDETGDKRNEPR